MTHAQDIALGKAIRKSLQIGDRVAIIPRCSENSKQPKTIIVRSMYVRELHNKTTAGLSYKKDSKDIYGIQYAIIHPY